MILIANIPTSAAAPASGLCGACGDAGAIDGLYAVRGTLTTWWRCPGCGAEWETVEPLERA